MKTTTHTNPKRQRGTLLRISQHISPLSMLACKFFLVAVMIWKCFGLVRDVPAQETKQNPVLSGLVGRWLLSSDLQDHSGKHRHLTSHGVSLESIGGKDSRRAASFNGRDSHLALPADQLPNLQHGEFSISVWIYANATEDDVPGDVVSQYDSQLRRGFHLSLKTNTGVTLTQANTRQLQFGIDNARPLTWEDCGRPGQSILAFSLVSHEGELYAGTCEPGKTESGRVYRYGGKQFWMDCGAPAPCNSVTAMAAFKGKLYAGVGKYRVAGSSLPESENAELGGKVFCYEAGQWTDCGQLPGSEAVSGMVVFRGSLYAACLYKPAGFFRYDGGEKWTDCGVPNGMRVASIGVYNGYLYGTSYDGGRVARFDGSIWTDCGQLGSESENTQTYGFAVYQGQLFCGTWRSGRVYRFDEPNLWVDVGRLGEEMEVMGMIVHNGRMFAGTLPSGEVYEYRGTDVWQRVGELDTTPNVRYRRAWTLAEHHGRMYCSVLPSGRIWSTEAGKMAAWDHEFPAGWHHVAAVKGPDRLLLYVDGKQVAESTRFEHRDFDLTSNRPFQIGAGENDFFTGGIRDVQLFHRSLSADEVASLHRDGKK